MSEEAQWMMAMFMLGFLAAAAIFDCLWRIARRTANDLIGVQREYIAELEKRS